MARSASSWAGVSTPSATVVIPRLRAITITACAMARSSLLSGSALTKERSTFRVLTLKRLR